jgi:PiT family inorganic phosphate transporter
LSCAIQTALLKPRVFNRIEFFAHTGTGRYGYSKVLAWATVCAFAGSAFGIYVSGGLVKVFTGGQFLVSSAGLAPSFPAAVALAAAATVLLATWIGAPVSTTHALTGALLGAGAVAVGVGQVKWAAAASAIGMPLLVSPLLAVVLTLGLFPLMSRWIARRACICVVESAVAAAPGLRMAAMGDCDQSEGAQVWNTEEVIHWTSAGAISFSRTLNDTPKIAALVLAARLAGPAESFLLVGTLMAIGGLAAARAVARTMSQRVTQIDPVGGMSANLVEAVLVGIASRFGLPVSTTHVTMGGIFGIGISRRERTNWNLVAKIVLAWLVTMPLGLACGAAAQYLLLATR